MFIKVRELTVVVRETGKPVVEGVSFDLGRDERLGIIGESGSGKSVTTLALMGLLPDALRAEGSIQVDGREVVGASESELLAIRGSDVARVFQDPSAALDPLCRVERLVAEPLRRHRRLSGDALRDAVRASLREVSLPDDQRFLKAFPFEVSGGQRQRVAIAMALACDPTVLIGDEPTTALDVTVQADVARLLTDLSHERGMGLLFVSHDIALVAGMVERILVMRDGRIVEAGTTEEVISRPTNPYTRGLVDSARALEHALETGRL